MPTNLDIPISRAMTREVATLILAGGVGARLQPLTTTRCKPAISFAGRYRLIDIAISNAINSGFTEIYILSQFLASSLTRYLMETYHTHNKGINLEILVPEESCVQKVWYEGTADAVRKNLHRFHDHPAEYFIILSGDQLYSMDLQEMLDFAKEKDADLTIATIPVAEKEATRMGVMKIDPTFQIFDFVEKPQERSQLLEYAIAPDIAKKHNALDDLSFLGSMGIYIFKRKALFDLLEQGLQTDFGKHLLPQQIKRGKTYAYIFSGYWEDVGTISSYYNASLNLTKNHLCLDLYNEKRPIYTQSIALPSPRISNTHVLNSILCDGSIISAHSITHSMIGMKTFIEEGTIIKDSILIGWHPNSQYTPIHIGKHCSIEKAIIDEGAILGDHVTLTNQNNLTSFESSLISIREGIIVVKAGAEIPSHFTL